LFSESTWRQERDAIWEQNENKADSAKHMEQKIMEWAKELQTVSEVRSASLTPRDICDNVKMYVRYFLNMYIIPVCSAVV